MPVTRHAGPRNCTRLLSSPGASLCTLTSPPVAEPRIRHSIRGLVSGCGIRKILVINDLQIGLELEDRGIWVEVTKFPFTVWPTYNLASPLPEHIVAIQGRHKPWLVKIYDWIEA